MKHRASAARELAASREAERSAADARVRTGFQSLLRYAARPDHVQATYPISLLPPRVREDVYTTPVGQDSGMQVEAHVYYRRKRLSPSEAFLKIISGEDTLFSIHGLIGQDGTIGDCLLNDAKHSPVSVSWLNEKRFSVMRSGELTVVTGREAIEVFEATVEKLK